jgi:phage shock protein PspC (stress-responsive transcriptional regulator)
MSNTPVPLNRLTRSDDRMLGGVCGGLGEYLGVDPTVLRLLWVIVFLSTGVGGFLYVVAWWVVPPRDRGGRSGRR